VVIFGEKVKEWNRKMERRWRRVRGGGEKVDKWKRMRQRGIRRRRGGKKG
jgi:hypothetical protein